MHKYFAGIILHPQIKTYALKKMLNSWWHFYSFSGRKMENWRLSRQQSLLEYRKQYSWRDGVEVEVLYSKCQSQFITDQQGAALITVLPLWDGRRVFLLETDAGASPWKGRTKEKKTVIKVCSSYADLHLWGKFYKGRGLLKLGSGSGTKGRAVHHGIYCCRPSPAVHSAAAFPRAAPLKKTAHVKKSCKRCRFFHQPEA